MHFSVSLKIKIFYWILRKSFSTVRAFFDAEESSSFAFRFTETTGFFSGTAVYYKGEIGFFCRKLSYFFHCWLLMVLVYALIFHVISIVLPQQFVSLQLVHHVLDDFVVLLILILFFHGLFLFKNN